MGVGLGLFLDEIGLLLTWGDYYSNTSYIVSLFVLGLFLNFLYLKQFWSSFKEQLHKQKPSFFSRAFVKNHGVLFFTDVIIRKYVTQEYVAVVFSSLLFIAVGISILAFPLLLQYILATAFILLGIYYLFFVQASGVKNEETI